MLNRIQVFFDNLLQNLRLADLLDIALVAGFLFLVLSWIRMIVSRGTPKRTLGVFIIVAVVYVLARFFGLFLTEGLIEVLLIVLTVAAVVAFQTDLRRMVDWIGAWGITGRTPEIRSETAVINTLTETTAKLAEIRRGALIAIRGREPWDRLIEGGIDLGGRMSMPLLISLFNPSSPGHDGAILMEGDRLLKFGAHLPLATHLPDVSRYGGTRHTAALGLAEQCDALVIVVSEERGTISIAEQGQLEVLESASALKERLKSFWEFHYDRKAEHRNRRFWRQVRLAAMSVVLASLAWIVFAYRPDMVFRTFVVPIEMRDLASNWSLGEDVPVDARITLSGPEQTFRLLNPSSLAITLNLSELEAGANAYAITTENINLPDGLTLYSVEPNTIEFEARAMIAVTVPVRVQATGALPDSVELVNLVPQPARATVLFPAGSRPPDSIRTESVNFRDLSESTTVTRILIPDSLMRLGPDQESEVQVQVNVRVMRDSLQGAE